MKKYSLLLVISCIWGSQFFFIELVTNDLGSITLSALKALIGAIYLTVISLFLPKENNNTDNFKKYFWIALFEVVLPFILIAQGQKYVSSSIASMLIAMVPIFTLVFLALFFKKKVRKLEIVSIILGFIGIVILSWPTQGKMNVSGNIFGNVLLILAAMSFAVSLILMEKLEGGSPVLHMRNVLWIASIVLLPLAFLFEQPLQMNINNTQILYIIILGMFHAGIVYMLYNLLIQVEGVLFASFSNYIVPVIGVILGYFILNEPLLLKHKVGILIILLAVLFSNKDIFRKRAIKDH
ncbi:DMT family transporter [Neobacillus novalis]|uniref:DMT family transporter n=1 Tax=Neobacillus novalis TaxID=220687 RepID=A0AA95MV68_9BACI|nr:DMT family transporter [Neobacillus novalis]WHY88630.1 DMT family transporter [Neobacillus novalis]